MSRKGPIVLVEDDVDDQSIMEEVIREVGINNQLIFFSNGPEAFKFLKTTKSQPFLILSDVNLPI